MFLLLPLLVSSIALSPRQPPETGSNGPLKTVMIAVPDIEQFDRQWAVKTDGAEVTSTSKLVRGKPTFVVVLFGGCQTDENATCRIEVRPNVTGPDGKPYDGLDGTKVLPAEEIQVARSDAFYLAPQLLGIRIEPGELLGPYQIRMTVTDVNASRSVTLKDTLTAVEAE